MTLSVNLAASTRTLLEDCIVTASVLALAIIVPLASIGRFNVLEEPVGPFPTFIFNTMPSSCSPSSIIGMSFLNV